MKKNFVHILQGLALSGLCLLAACSSEELSEVASTPEPGVSIRIKAPAIEADWTEGSRSLEAMSDELQKKIHNIYYFFYDEEGYIEKIFYQDVSPSMELEVPFQDFIDACTKAGDTWKNPKGSLYLLVNSENANNNGLNNEKPVLYSVVSNGTAVEEWKKTVSTTYNFEKSALIPIFFSHDPNTAQPDNVLKGLPGHLMMFGYFEGDIVENSKGHILEIALGRVAVRMRVSLSGAGLGKQARISILNAPAYTALFPLVSPLPPQEHKDIYWHDYHEMISTKTGEGIVGTAGDYSASLFYYCGENEYYYSNTKTILQIDTWDTYDASRKANGTEKGDRTYTIELGHNGPNLGTGRNFSLYRNTSYTFNIHLDK